MADHGQDDLAGGAGRPRPNLMGRLGLRRLAARFLPVAAWLWRIMRTMTFAILMLLVILAIVIAGSFLPQDNGIRLVYESWWFYGLNLLLMLSIVSCVARRIRPVYRFSFRVPVVRRREFYIAGDTARTLHTSQAPDRAAAAVRRVLRGHYYRVELARDGDRFSILADRFRLMRLGTLVSHLSIVLMVAAIAWGAVAGWLDRSLALEAGGPAVPVGHGTGLMLRSEAFDFDLYPNGQPQNFKDRLTIVARDGTAHHQTIDVNTPWYYGGPFGYDVHQADYGVAARLLVVDKTAARPTLLPYCLLQFSPSPDCTSAAPAMLLQPAGDGSYNPAGTTLSAFYLPAQDLAVTLSFHDAVPKDRLPESAVVTVARPPQKAGQRMQIVKEALDIPVGKHQFGTGMESITVHPVDVGNLRIVIWIRREAFVNVGHDPAVPFIFTAFGLILLGLVSVLYFPFSRIWIFVGPAENETPGSTLLLRGSAEKSRQGFRRRFAALCQQMERDLETDRTSEMGESGRP